MYIRGNKLIELLEEFKSTNPKKEDRIPYEEWRKLVNFLTNTKDLKLQVKTEPNTLIIVCPPTDNPLRFNTGNYFIKFFQERPITTILSSPKFEAGHGINYITDEEGNRFAVLNLGLELSDYRISDVEPSEVFIEEIGKEYQAFGISVIRDPDDGQLYYWGLNGTLEPLTQYYDTDSTSTSSSNTLNLTTGSTSFSTAPSDYNATATNSQSYLRFNSYGELEYGHPD